MNRDQARTLLIALGTPSREEDRAHAVAVVLDLLEEPAPCSCNNPDEGATHPLGDSAFCHAAP